MEQDECSPSPANVQLLIFIPLGRAVIFIYLFDFFFQPSGMCYVTLP